MFWQLKMQNIPSLGDFQMYYMLLNPIRINDLAIWCKNWIFESQNLNNFHIFRPISMVPRQKLFGFYNGKLDEKSHKFWKKSHLIQWV